METVNLQSLIEAYSAVYDEELREEYLEEDYSFIDGLDDEELTDVVEEVIYDLLDEGYEVEELEDLFEDTFLTEARVDMAARAKARRDYARSSEQSARQARKAGAAVVKKEKREERKEKIKSAARGVLSSIKKGVKRAAKKVGIGVEKAKQAMQGRDRSAERSTRRAKASMKKAAVKNIRKAVTGKAEAPKPTPKAVEKKVSRKDVTGSTGAGAAGTIRSKSTTGSGDGPSSKGRALPPKGATSRTDAGNLRKPSQVTFALSRAAKAGKKKMEKLNNSFDMFDIVADFLISEGLADDFSEVNWIMANEITEEHMEQIADLYDVQELFGLGKKKANKKPLGSGDTEYHGKSMIKPEPKKPYNVDTRRPKVTVHTYGKGGKTDKFKTRGRV